MSPVPARRARNAVHLFFVVAVLAAGTTFVFKLHAFLATARRDELLGFAGDPILTYGWVAAGFFLLLAWAFLTGQLSKLEDTKVRMLERALEQERREGLLAEDGGEEART